MTTRTDTTPTPYVPLIEWDEHGLRLDGYPITLEELQALLRKD